MLTDLEEWAGADDVIEAPDDEPDTLTPALDRLAGILLDLQVYLGNLQERQDRHYRLLEKVAQEVYPLAVPAVSAKVAAGGALTISDSEQLGPKVGYVWDVRRISLTGLAANTESVTLWKVGTAATVSAQPQNFVCTLTGPSAFQPFGLGQLMLRAQDKLMVTGTGLTAGEAVTLSADGFSIGAEWVGIYLL